MAAVIMDEDFNPSYLDPATLFIAIKKSNNVSTKRDYLNAIIMCFETGNESFATDAEKIIAKEALDALIVLAQDKDTPVDIKAEAQSYLLARFKTKRDLQQNRLTADIICRLYDFSEQNYSELRIHNYFTAAVDAFTFNYTPSLEFMNTPPSVLSRFITNNLVSDQVKSTAIKTIFLIFENGNTPSATDNQKHNANEALAVLLELSKLARVNRFASYALLYLQDLQDYLKYPHDPLENKLTPPHIDKISLALKDPPRLPSGEGPTQK